jgi:NADH dehydrogenase
VQPDLTLPGRPEVLALGDMVRVATPGGDAVTLPGLAPVAMQQGRYAARVVGDRLAARATPPFHYLDKGNLATIGRARAVVDVRGVHVSGLLAWLTWLVVHLLLLVGFQNRVLVVIRWTVSFVTRGRGARLIAHEAQADAVTDEPPAVAVHAAAGGGDRARTLDRG